MPVIIVSGTPGTGKTTLAKKIAREKKYKYIDVNRVIKKYKIAESYDKKKKCAVIDTKKLNAKLIKIIKQEKNVVIDSHLSHYLPKKYVDLCVITTCSLPVLKKRLGKRKYSKQKIRDNLDAEIFETCFLEAKKAGHKVKVVNTTKK